MSQTLDAASLDLIFREARSYNGYTDQPVTEAEMRAIWDLARMGPTATNQSPARILWCASDEAKAKLAPLTSEKNAPKILQAPVTAIIGMDHGFPDLLPKLFPHVDARPWFSAPEVIATSAFRNSSLQGAYFIIAARALGLDTGPMSGFDNAAVDAAFFAGTKIQSNFICTLGHGDPASIFARLPRLDFEEANTIL